MQQTTNRQPKSWELRKKDPTKYRFVDVSDQVLVKKPGEIQGEQFILRNCQRCTIFLLDYSATILIDDCVDCKFFFGPCESSLFIRGSRKCKMIAACGQFRSKKCEDIQSLLFSQSQPIIELSVRMGFGCFRGYYPHLAEHLKKAKLCRWNNTWSDLFDFNPETRPEEQHFYLMFEDTRFEDLMPPISTVLDFDPESEKSIERQVIPFTSELRKKNVVQDVLLIFYPAVNLDFDKLSASFQASNFEVAQSVFEEEEEETDVQIDAPEIQYCFLVKSRWEALYADNWPAFKSAVERGLGNAERNRLLAEIVTDGRLQRTFSIRVQSEQSEVKVTSFLHTLVDMRLGVRLQENAVLVEGAFVEELARLLFANQEDERGGGGGH